MEFVFVQPYSVKTLDVAGLIASSPNERFRWEQYRIHYDRMIQMSKYDKYIFNKPMFLSNENWSNDVRLLQRLKIISVAVSLDSLTNDQLFKNLSLLQVFQTVFITTIGYLTVERLKMIQQLAQTQTRVRITPSLRFEYLEPFKKFGLEKNIESINWIKPPTTEYMYNSICSRIEQFNTNYIRFIHVGDWDSSNPYGWSLLEKFLSIETLSIVNYEKSTNFTISKIKPSKVIEKLNKLQTIICWVHKLLPIDFMSWIPRLSNLVLMFPLEIELPIYDAKLYNELFKDITNIIIFTHGCNLLKVLTYYLPVAIQPDQLTIVFKDENIGTPIEKTLKHFDSKFQYSKVETLLIEYHTVDPKGYFKNLLIYCKLWSRLFPNLRHLKLRHWAPEMAQFVLYNLTEWTSLRQITSNCDVSMFGKNQNKSVTVQKIAFDSTFNQINFRY